MNFNFSLFNHAEPGRLELGDLVNIIGAQLLELGHKVTRSDDFKRGINLVFERFDDSAVEGLKEREKDEHVVIIATEVPGETAFNNGYRSDMRYRQNTFPSAAREANAIWVLAPDKGGWYAAWGTPAARIQLGHAYNLRQARPENPSYDFAFYGQITSYRSEVLGEFMRAGFNLNIAGKILDADERDKLVASAKAVLELSAYPESPLISSSRCATTLHLGRAVFCEPKKVESEWNDIITVSTEENVFDQARDIVTNYRDAYRTQKEAFRNKLTPEHCLGAGIGALT